MKHNVDKVLLVYYYYPPYASGGTFRPAKMTRYLPEFHIRPSVVCADKIPRRPKDEYLSAEIPTHLDIRRVPVRFENSLYYRFMYKLGKVPSLNAKFKPETTIKWTDDVLPVAKEILDQNGIDTFLVSAPPWCMILLGKRIKEKTGKRFILEYRDPWTQGPFYNPPGQDLTPEFERMELEALEAADEVVMVTESFALLMVDKWPFLAGKIHVVPNGYDRNDFPVEIVRPSDWGDRFVIAYAGSIYTDYHTDVFLDGLTLWLDRNPSLRERVLMSYTGFMDRRQVDYIRASGLDDIVERRGYVHHQAAVGMLCAADLLVLALPDILNAGGHISAKIYEYMASGTPILASLPGGEMSRLIEESGTGWVIPPGNPESVVSMLDDIHKQHLNGRSDNTSDADYINRFTRRNAAGKLADVIRGHDRR